MGFFRKLFVKLGLMSEPKAGASTVTRCPSCGNGGHARVYAHKKAIGRALRLKQAVARGS